MVRGLLVCNMLETAKGVVENLIEAQLQNDFEGCRVCTWQRSGLQDVTHWMSQRLSEMSTSSMANHATNAPCFVNLRLQGFGQGLWLCSQWHTRLLLGSVTAAAADGYGHGHF